MRFSTSALLIVLTAVCVSSSSAIIESPRLRGNRGLTINHEEAEKLHNQINFLQTELNRLKKDNVSSEEDDESPSSEEEEDEIPSEDEDEVSSEEDDEVSSEDDIPSLEDDTTPIEDDESPSSEEEEDEIPSEDEDEVSSEEEDEVSSEDDIPSLEDDTTPIEDDDGAAAPEDEEYPNFGGNGNGQNEEHPIFYGNGPGGFYFPPIMVDGEGDIGMGLDDEYPDIDDQTPMTPGDGTELEVISSSSSED
mmetsp:Transcript_56911/g.68094  ORF Transcript_56911/g.68094 Transcript_56911/m.68094 type:complete len:249 (+) Transcript_56911:166-912(+)